MALVVTGSIAYDYLMCFPGRFSELLLPEKLDCISVSFLVDAMERRRGGCAANIAYTLALLGERPRLVGCAGRDFEEYQAFLESVGVDTSAVWISESVFTASFFANTDLDGNQICSFYTGAMRYARELSLQALDLQKEDWVIVSPNDPEAMVRYARECRDLGIPFLFDPSQQIARLDKEALLDGALGARFLIVNEYELEMFKSKTGLTDSDLLSVSNAVIVTLGDRGAEIRTCGERIPIPIAPPERIVDPTGVGDAFRAGFMKGLVCGLPLETCGRMGSLAATYCLESLGGQSHQYTLENFVERYVQTFGQEISIP